LFDDLVRHFGEDSVFMDVAGIEPGRDFRRVIDEHVASCGMLLAMIGKTWIDATDESGRRRLEDPMDFVRLETASALKRDIPVVPVLVHGARMPRAEQLPKDLAELAFRNGVELTHARWDSDVQVLVKALSPHVESSQKNADRVNSAASTDVPKAAQMKSTGPDSGVPQTAEATAFVSAHSAKKSFTMIVAGSLTALVIAGGRYAWYQKSSERAEAIRQAALLQEAKKQAAAEDLEAKKQAAEKALAVEAEAKRRSQEMAAAEEREKIGLAREKAAAEKREADRRAQEITDAKKRDAERRDSALAEERERMKLARENALAEEREKMRLAQERAAAAQRARWSSYNFPPPNGGLLVYTIRSDGNPVCASYDGGSCLWGHTYDQIDFNRLRPLACGEEHRAKWGLSGYENLKHWCNLARRISADRRYLR